MSVPKSGMSPQQVYVHLGSACLAAIAAHVAAFAAAAFAPFTTHTFHPTPPEQLCSPRVCLPCYYCCPSCRLCRLDPQQLWRAPASPPMAEAPPFSPPTLPIMLTSNLLVLLLWPPALPPLLLRCPPPKKHLSPTPQQHYVYLGSACRAAMAARVAAFAASIATCSFVGPSLTFGGGLGLGAGDTVSG